MEGICLNIVMFYILFMFVDIITIKIYDNTSDIYDVI